MGLSNPLEFILILSMSWGIVPSHGPLLHGRAAHDGQSRPDSLTKAPALSELSPKKTRRAAPKGHPSGSARLSELSSLGSELDAIQLATASLLGCVVPVVICDHSDSLTPKGQQEAATLSGLASGKSLKLAEEVAAHASPPRDASIALMTIAFVKAWG